jgi:hypothetical protein
MLSQPSLPQCLEKVFALERGLWIVILPTLNSVDAKQVEDFAIFEGNCL